MKFDYYIFNSYVPELDGDASDLYAKWLEQIDVADELGFTTAWFTEHHFHQLGGMMPSPQLIMAAVAQRTKRIRIGTAVTLLALHNPLRIAEDLAVLDVMSGGRVDVGIGRGMEWLNYAAFGSDWRTSQERCEEGVDVLREAWTSDCFSWHSEFLECDGVRLMPKPVQKPHPPIWFTANRDPNHFKWVGQRGLNLMTIPWTNPSFDMAAPLVGQYREALREAGHDPASREVLSLFPVYVSDSDEQAQREVETYWQNMRGIVAAARGDTRREDPSAVLIADDRALFGGPKSVRRQVERIRDEIGPTHLCLQFHFGGLPQDLVLKSMRLFMTEVAPGV